MHKEKKSICIISFSPIYRDARVLRQIKYLSTFYDLDVIGYGRPHPDWENTPNIKWNSVNYLTEPMNAKNHPKTWGSLGKFLTKRMKKFIRPSLRPKTMMEYFVLFLGRLNPSLYETWFWKKRQHSQALKYAAESGCAVFLANDWEALPVVAEAARRNHARLIFDAHEYAPLELENRRYWRILFQPAVIYFLKKYAPRIDASLTVAPLISERYNQEFGLNPIVVLNTPERMNLAAKGLDFNNVRLIHHGGVIPDRQLEKMIETVAICDRRFSLHFMLIKNNINYLNQLKSLANKIASGRVVFHEPVTPEKVVQRVSEFDIGFCLIAPTNYNYLVSLPNKFFDYVVAGLAVCIGPSPSMAEMVNKYGFGVVASSFDPQDVADSLNKLTREQISMMCLASQEASKRINAEIEMGKLVELCNRTLDSSQ